MPGQITGRSKPTKLGDRAPLNQLLPPETQGFHSPPFFCFYPFPSFFYTPSQNPLEPPPADCRGDTEIPITATSTRRACPQLDQH